MITLADWRLAARKLFGDDASYWLFACPACTQVQSHNDFVAMGMPAAQISRYLAFSCIGRFRLDDPDVVDYGELTKGRGCRYVGGGVFNISPVELEISAGEIRPTFAFAKGLST